jgi:hypothetical protein
MIILFWHSQIRGEMCRACLDRSFGEAFWPTLVLGWWGLVSFFATLFFLPYDLVHYLLTRGSYGKEPDAGSGARLGMAIGVGALGLLTPMCLGPYLLLAALGTLPDAWGPQPDDASARRWPGVCDGTVDHAAPAYDPGAPHASALRHAEDGWRVSPDLVPVAWRTSDDPAALVICIHGEHERVIETCESGARRFAYPRDVRIVEARSGREITRTTVEGADAPAPCALADTLPHPDTARLSGARVQDTQLAPAIEALAARGLPALAP